MSKNLHGVYLTDVLTEMCDRVGVKYEDIDFAKDEWYLEHEWTKEDQDDFINWFAIFLQNTGVRQELCKYPPLVRTKDERLKFSRSFVSEFGWKIKQ